MTKETVFLVSPNPESKEDKPGWGYFSFFTKVLVFLFSCLLFLPFGSQAQNTLTPETINNFKTNYQSVQNLEPQTIPINSYFLRFNELGAIYNPNFPNTRNRVYVGNYKLEENKLVYIGKSVSTYRASIILKNRVGEFYSLWKGQNCSSLVHYFIQKECDELVVTGKIYKCCSAL